MQTRNRIKVNKVAITVQILLITTIIAVCLTLSKYETAVASEVTTIVALNEFSTTITDIELEQLGPESPSSNYRFKIQNFDTNDTNKIAQTAMEYTIQVKSGSLLPLNFELREIIDGTVQDVNLLGDNTGNITDLITFSAGNATTHEYMLIINWDENEKNYKYSGEVDYVQIVVNGNQVEI